MIFYVLLIIILMMLLFFTFISFCLALNLYDEELERCAYYPLTGQRRDGYCD